QAEDGIRDFHVTGVHTCALPLFALSVTVRVGAPDGLGTYFLAAELGVLAERHPHLTFQLVVLPRTCSLSKREADIAVTVEQPTEIGRAPCREKAESRLARDARME